MRCNLFLGGKLAADNADVSVLLSWLSKYWSDLPDDLFVNIYIEEGEKQ